MISISTDRKTLAQMAPGRPEWLLSIPPGRVVIHKPTDKSNGDVAYHFTILPHTKASQEKDGEPER